MAPSEKRAMLLETVVVLCVTLAPTLIWSVLLVVGSGARDGLGDIALGPMFVHSVDNLVAILLVVYVIARRGESVREFGCSPKLRVIPSSLGLFVASVAISWLVYIALEAAGLVDGEFETQYAPMGGSKSWTVAVIVVAAVHEELIVRAYFMTRLRQIGCSVAVTILLSTLLQWLLHVYQGWDSLAHLPAFLLFSVYFVRYRDVLGVMLVHIYVNSWMFLL